MGIFMGFREPSSSHPPRALATNTAQAAHGAGPQGPPSDHDSLEGPARSKEQSPPQSQATSHLTGEMPPNQASATCSTSPGPGASPAGDHGGALGEARLEATGVSARKHMSPGALSFREVLARAANAHYVRHRVPPEAERLLSMGEIFGHRGLGTQCRAPEGHLSDPPEPSE